MQLIFKFWVHLALFLVLTQLSLGAQTFRDVKSFTLKKDEQKRFLIKYGAYERLFKMRWTLYTDEVLIVLDSYDRNVAQHTLSLKDRNSSFRIFLRARGEEEIDMTYILIRFKKFDFEKYEAAFELLLADKKEQIELKELGTK